MHSTRKKKNLSGSEFVLPGGRTLQILKAKVSDGGKYSCVAMNAAGEAHKHIYLTVFSESTSTLCIHRATHVPLMVNVVPPPPVPPSIRDSSGDSPVVVNVLAGKPVTLECASNAVPPPTITWYKNGRVVTESANLRILADGQMLQIQESEVRDVCCSVWSSPSSLSPFISIFEQWPHKSPSMRCSA